MYTACPLPLTSSLRKVTEDLETGGRAPICTCAGVPYTSWPCRGGLKYSLGSTGQSHGCQPCALAIVFSPEEGKPLAHPTPKLRGSAGPQSARRHPMCSGSTDGEEAMHRSKNHALGKTQSTGHTWQVTDVGLWGDGIAASSTTWVASTEGISNLAREQSLQAPALS